MTDSPAKRPPTGKEIFGSILFAAIFIGIGVSMFIWPEGLTGDEDASGRRTRSIMRILAWIWSTPGGIVLIILGLLFGASAFMKRDVEKAE